MAKKLCLLRDAVKEISRQDLYGSINESARVFAHKEPVGALFDLNVDITKMFQTIG